MMINPSILLSLTFWNIFIISGLIFYMFYKDIKEEDKIKAKYRK